MIIEEEDLPANVIKFIQKIKNKYEFDDTEAVTHMVDLIEKYQMEKSR